jgi:hypothetical protein
MAEHARFTIDTGIDVYFCDPKSPWQRGSNENTNGLLRQYLPCHVSFRDYSQDDLDGIAAELAAAGRRAARPPVQPPRGPGRRCRTSSNIIATSVSCGPTDSACVDTCTPRLRSLPLLTLAVLGQVEGEHGGQDQ